MADAEHETITPKWLFLLRLETLVRQAHSSVRKLDRLEIKSFYWASASGAAGLVTKSVVDVTPVYQRPGHKAQSDLLTDAMRSYISAEAIPETMSDYFSWE